MRLFLFTAMQAGYEHINKKMLQVQYLEHRLYKKEGEIFFI